MKLASLVLIACLALAGAAFAARWSSRIQGQVRDVSWPNGVASSAMAKSMGLTPLNSPDVQKTSAADMTALVANTKGKMTACEGKLSHEEISAVVTYVKGLK